MLGLVFHPEEIGVVLLSQKNGRIPICYNSPTVRASFGMKQMSLAISHIESFMRTILVFMLTLPLVLY